MNLHYPLNPNQNPNPNFPNPQFNFPPPPPIQSQTPIPDLPNSISTLKTLIQSSNSTLQSLTSLLPSIPPIPNSNPLIQCPSNPNHWLPSPSLFLHSLNCPFPLGINPKILHYPKTLNKDQNFTQGSKFVQPLDDPNAELCFSIDDYVDFDCNFFYRNCPGVVTAVDSDVSRRLFTIPGVLGLECANFVGFSDNGSVVFDRGTVRVLPSEVWFIGREVESWRDYPSEYSLFVCKAVLCVEWVKECDLSKWVVENSPRFGVVIDVPMGDHLCVLVRLCLKAMVREGSCFYGGILKGRIDDESRNYNPRSLSLKCPVLVEVLRWLTSQLSILYGKMNARSLVIALVKHFLSEAASHASLFPLDTNLDLAYGNDQETNVPSVQTSEKVTENKRNGIAYETICSRPIFVYQIAAAIAALHERSLLEERIRALRNPANLTPYQRLAEHSHFSRKADEERQKRPEYRPLIEHDGLLNQRQQNQGGNKPKTKEELLAEERDYKRRRMSYRGKKLKRSTKEVMRDIIEDYMEAIKHAGGIGGPTKGNPEVSLLTSTNSSALAATSSNFNHSSRIDVQDDHRTLSDDDKIDNTYADSKPIHNSRRREQHKRESHSHRYSDDRRMTSKDRSDREYYPRSPSRDRRRSRSKDRGSPSRKQVYIEKERSKSNYPSSKRSSYHDYRKQNSPSSSLRISSDYKERRKSPSPGRQRWQNVEINDRYDPSETSHSYDDHLGNSNYTSPTS